jgi:hypothetical protein
VLARDWARLVAWLESLDMDGSSLNTSQAPVAPSVNGEDQPKESVHPRIAGLSYEGGLLLWLRSKQLKLPMEGKFQNNFV